MKTTLLLDDHLVVLLKQEAHRQKRTMSQIVDDSLRISLTKKSSDQPKLNPLPTFSGGELLCNISNREALYRVLDAED